eukprot:124267-Prorocentrum_minimum.AAC.2
MTPPLLWLVHAPYYGRRATLAKTAAMCGFEWSSQATSQLSKECGRSPTWGGDKSYAGGGAVRAVRVKRAHHFSGDAREVGGGEATAVDTTAARAGDGGRVVFDNQLCAVRVGELLNERAVAGRVAHKALVHCANAKQMCESQSITLGRFRLFRRVDNSKAICMGGRSMHAWCKYEAEVANNGLRDERSGWASHDNKGWR